MVGLTDMKWRSSSSCSKRSMFAALRASQTSIPSHSKLGKLAQTSFPHPKSDSYIGNLHQFKSDQELLQFALMNPGIITSPR
ncbi:hypothetical protein SAY87_019396 [Trapa incisa]|uniref:Uncharacterized protein n=1 Tax=Trapa incisa TaxID=236973 RepID=A0AAN7K7F0_9MYRT|nr:hypothetical protein SAY87_019396 [Trapa incisa]